MADLPLLKMQKGLILGIDLGSSSLGTALVSPENEEIPFLGVRIFPAGVVGDIEEGREESRSAQRRDARLARRQTQRRQRRLYKVFHLLQRMGLLPSGPRVEVLYKLQRELERRYPETTVVPYFLRARALDQALDEHELGRALYHLAQRRGFLSNRAGGKEDAEQRSIVKGSIKGLRAAIEAAGKRTLGEYMASLDPRATPIRNKPTLSEHYTHRSMYLDEFKLIWEAQEPFHKAILSEEHRAKLHHAMFHQRPLKDQSNLVGHCELEPDEKRAPLRLLASQRFRVLGFVNNLRVGLDDGNTRSLTANERAILLDLCEKSEKLSFPAARRGLGFAKSTKFTIEEGGEKNVPVNLVAGRLRAVLGDWWDCLTPQAKDDLVEDVGDGKRCKTDEDLELCAREKWQLAPEIAEEVSKVRLPDAYGRYCLKALHALLPALENGLNVEEAIRLHPQYLESRKTAEPLPLLPPVKDVLGEIRNPAVLRSLTEMRKTVNAIVRRYGKPEFMHVELARDLKKSKKERQAETGRNRDREKLRQLAVEELQKHDSVRYANPRGTDIEKYLLAMESRWQCPYTGREYSFVDVFGEHPSVDVEHIIPRSRSLDDSYLNKVLAYRSGNMEKGKRTPHEWLHESDEDRYDRMIAIVNGFDARFEVGRKLRRFSMELSEPDSLLAEFTARQLQETRYASKLACRYLGVLYGGEVDAEGNRRVFACAGQVTAKLRKAWDLNQILNPVGKPEKSRDDHRHHAVDALTIALTSTKMVRDLADAAGEADRLFRRKIILPVPWVNFAEAARSRIESIQVSHRPARKLSGPLHEETFYSRPRKYSIGVDAKGKPVEKEYVHFRVPVTKLASKAAAEDIVDVRVREAVIAKAEELGGGGNKFQNNWPVLHTRHGGSVPIKRVRIRKVQSVVPIGKEGRERFVISGSNHHAEIVAEMDAKGDIKRFVFSTVTMLEAFERKRQGVAIVNRVDEPGKRQFLCTLSEGDMVEAKRPGDSAGSLWKVRSVRQSGQLELTPARDARLKKDIAADKQLWSPAVGPLFLAGGRKVLVNHLGEVLPAND
jgi:CRISPR-associated endonuclease Csn1